MGIRFLRVTASVMPQPMAQALHNSHSYGIGVAVASRACACAVECGMHTICHRAESVQIRAFAPHCTILVQSPPLDAPFWTTGLS